MAIKDSEEKVLRDYVEDLYKFQDQVGLSDWEKDFISDMQRQRIMALLSAKQKQIIVQLAEKYL